MGFEPLAELSAAGDGVSVYAEGWQSWSPVGAYRVGEHSPRAPDHAAQTMGWRPEKPVPAAVVQAEGILVLDVAGEGARAWFAPEPEREVATVRLEWRDGRAALSADGPLDELRADDLDAALAAVSERLRRGPVRGVPPGWCSWYQYFGKVTEADVAENVAAAARLSLPVEVVQVDDGYEACVGDWLETAPRFGSLRDVAARTLAAGFRAGVWTAPFLVGERSALAAQHPDWLVEGADAAWNWRQRLRVLDVTHPAAAEHLAGVFRTLRALGFDYHKLDFLYAGALEGRRHAYCSPLEAYREGLRIVREAAGPDAILVGCGAPLLPSIGLVDAMRVGPDVLAELPDERRPELGPVFAPTAARAWMNGCLWVNDPDCLVVRPGIAGREEWASYLEGYGGVAFSSDRLAALDERGLELTRRVLGSRLARP